MNKWLKLRMVSLWALMAGIFAIGQGAASAAWTNSVETVLTGVVTPFTNVFDYSVGIQILAMAIMVVVGIVAAFFLRRRKV